VAAVAAAVETPVLVAAAPFFSANDVPLAASAGACGVSLAELATVGVAALAADDPSAPDDSPDCAAELVATAPEDVTAAELARWVKGITADDVALPVAVDPTAGADSLPVTVSAFALSVVDPTLNAANATAVANQYFRSCNFLFRRVTTIL